MSKSEDFSLFTSQDVMSRIVGQTTETLGNDDNDNEYNVEAADDLIPQEGLSMMSQKVADMENEIVDLGNQISNMRSDLASLDNKVSSIPGDVMFKIEELMNNLYGRKRPVSPSSQAVPTVQQPTVLPAAAVTESVGATTVVPVDTVQPKQLSAVGQSATTQRPSASTTGIVQAKQGTKNTPAPIHVTTRSSFGRHNSNVQGNVSTPTRSQTGLTAPRNPAVSRQSLSGVFNSPVPKNLSTPAAQVSQTVKPAEPLNASPLVKQSPDNVQPEPTTAGGRIDISPAFPPGVFPTAQTQEALDREAQGRNSLVIYPQDPHQLKVHKVPPDDLKLTADPTWFNVMKLTQDVEYFRLLHEQPNTTMAMFIGKKVLEKLFEKEAVRQSSLYKSIGNVEAMSSQPDGVIIQLLVNAILPINKNAHASILAEIAQTPQYSLSDIVFNSVGYHVSTFGRVNKFLEVMLKIHRLLNHNITPDNRLRLLEEGHTKEKDGVVNYILRAMKPLDANFIVLIKLEAVKKFKSVENFIQALKDVNGNLSKESQEIQSKAEKSMPMKEQEKIFEEVARKRAYAGAKKEGVPKQPEAIAKKKFFARKFKPNTHGKGKIAMAAMGESEDAEVSEEEESDAEDQESPSIVDEDSDTDSDSDEDSETKELRYRKRLQKAVVKDESGNEFYPSEHVINYVDKHSSDSKYKKVDTKTQPCYHQMKTPPACPNGDNCIFSHSVTVVGKRIDEDITKKMENPFYKQYKTLQKPKAQVKKAELTVPQNPIAPKQQPTIRILSSPSSAPSQLPRNYSPATSSKIQYAQPSGNTSESLDKVWG